jgi:hypothetical protein
MVDKHIALPKTLSDTGELEEWLAKFEICASANGWSDERKAAKILTFLEGEVLVAYIEMADQDKADYDRLVAALKREFRTTGAQFRLMNEFEHRRLLPGETPRVFLYNLKRLLETAMPELSGEAKEKFLFHKFIEGLPKDVSRLMRSSVTDINTTKEALAKANSLTVNFEGDLKEVASVQENEEKFGKILSEMNRRLESLESEQKVAIVQEGNDSKTSQGTVVHCNVQVVANMVTQKVSAGETPTGRCHRPGEPTGSKTPGLNTRFISKS